MNYWFTSDQHFYHKNIISFCNRPFSDIYEMNSTIINNYNNVVQDNDQVFLLGDFSWSGIDQTIDILKQLKGVKHYIIGNHDNVMKNDRIKKYLASCNDLCEINIKNVCGRKTNSFLCCLHYPMKSWNKSHWKSWHAHGHCHGTLPEDNSLSIDVGVDAVALRYAKNGVLDPNDYRPMCYDEMEIIMNNKGANERKIQI